MGLTLRSMKFGITKVRLQSPGQAMDTVIVIQHPVTHQSVDHDSWICFPRLEPVNTIAEDVAQTLWC